MAPAFDHQTPGGPAASPVSIAVGGAAADGGGVAVLGRHSPSEPAATAPMSLMAGSFPMNGGPVSQAVAGLSRPRRRVRPPDKSGH